MYGMYKAQWDEIQYVKGCMDGLVQAAVTPFFNYQSCAKPALSHLKSTKDIADPTYLNSWRSNSIIHTHVNHGNVSIVWCGITFLR